MGREIVPSGWILKARFCSDVYNTDYLLSPKKQHGGRREEI